MKCLLFVFLFVARVAVADNEPALFDATEPLNVVLTAPFKTLYKERRQEVRLYSDGRFSFEDGAGEKISVPVKVKTRGNFRRLNCSNPPLRLNFKKKGNDGTLLEGQDKLKLVAPCKRNDRYEGFLALEYLVYQIFARVSPYHFKTRLLDIGYLESGQQAKPWLTTAFLIEDISDAAARTEMEQKIVVKANRRKLDHRQTAIVEMFQFFIGNTDYSTLAAREGDDCCHNMRLIGRDGEDILVPVPYDFDSAGFVDTPYASPAEQYPITQTTQRYFTGWCKEDRFFHDAIAVFRSAKAGIYSDVQNSGLLSEKAMKKTLAFMDEFYELIDEEERVQTEIIDRCRGNVIPPPAG